ncbi:MAG: hypothetical protein Q7J31_03795, partial [Syntrophales bacterium]|nr:hypothetical protein [Syntrophales bacterium]
AGVTGSDIITDPVVTDTVGDTGTVKTSDIITNIVPQSQDAVPPEISLSLTPRIVSNAAVAAYAVPSNARALFLSSGGSLEAVFSLSSPELSSFSYLQTVTNLDGTKTVGTWSPISDPTKEFSFKLGNLTEGYHTFKITGKDASKNETTFEFTISGLALERIAEAGAVFQLTAKGPGEDSIKTVQIADAGGNVLSPATVPWVAEITASSRANIIVFFTPNKPAAVSNDKAPTIGVSATEEGITYSYSLDGGAAADSAGGTIKLSDLSEGSHTLSVKGKNAAGEFSTEISYTWTTDYTGPVVTIGTAASPDLSGAKLTSVTATLSTNESSTYSYSIDGGTLTSTGPSLTLSGLAEGSHTLSYTATDPAGNATTESLAFSLSRYSLAGNVADLSGVTVGSVTAGEVAGVSNQDWGGWNISMGGNVEGPPPASFTAAAGGRSTDTVAASNDGGYWLESIEGTYDGVSALSGKSALMYLSSDRVGGGYGAFTGSYSAASNTWQATDLGLGIYTETPLAFMSEINPDLYYYVTWWGLTYDGTLTGLLGGTESLWSASPYVTIIGEYDSIHGAPQPRIWYSSDIYSYNYKDSSYTTYDDGAYRGFMGGIVLDDVLEGKFLSLYIDPSGNAGYLSGDLSGKVYPDIKIFEMGGTISKNPQGTVAEVDIPASDLYSSITRGNLDGRMTGNFAGIDGGAIRGWTDQGDTFFIKNQLWGIFGLTIVGEFETPVNSTWSSVAGGNYSAYGDFSDYGYWLADITDGTAEANKLTGTVKGKFITNTMMGDASATTGALLGTGINGDLLGTYNTGDNTWQAVSLGTWSGEPLSHVSSVNSNLGATARYNYTVYFYDDGGVYYNVYLADNNSGYVYYYRPGTETPSYYYIQYNSVGTYSGWDYVAGTSLSGTWDPETESLASLIGTAPVGGTLYDSGSRPYSYNDGWINALMGGTDSLWTATAENPIGSSVPVTIIGEYYQDYAGNMPHIWDTEISSYNYKDDTHTTYDGGAYKGFLAGTQINDDMDARLIALYIDPSGNAGYLKGSLTGTAYPDIGMFEMDGGVYPTRVASNIGIAAGDLNNSVYTTYSTTTYGQWYYANRFAGAFDTGGEITDYYNLNSYVMRTMSLVNYEANKAEPWGIYSMDFIGTFTKPETDATSWTAKAGENSSFGAYYNDYYGFRFNDDWGYWLADVKNGIWADGRLTGTVGGRFLTYTKLGTIEGDLSGTYNTADNTWQAVSLGTWNGNLLSYSGRLTWGRFGDVTSWDNSSNISGIVGSTNSIWSSPQSVAIGRYSNPNSKPMWDIDISGKTDLTNTTNTAEHGAFYMSGGGIALGDTIEGRAVGMYIKPDGQGGYLGGYLSTDLFTSDTYPGISMWEASPTITASTGVPTTVTPSEFYWGSKKFRVSWLNNHAISGAISGVSNTELLSLIDQNWGRWMSWSAGTYTAPFSDNWSAQTGGRGNIGVYYSSGTSFIPDYGYWLADVTNGTAADGRLTGDVTGRFLTYTKLGEINGNLLGLYNTTDKTWQAVSLGMWSGEPLSFVSEISAYSDGWLEGLMGGVASLWTATQTSPASVTMIGRYNPYYSNVPHVWGTEISSYNYKDSSNTTYDGGAYWGYLGGTEIGGSMEGGLIALYIDPDGNAGYLKGSLAGTAYPELEMFEMEGGVYPVQMATGIGISPAELYNAISVTNETWGTVNDFTFNSFAMGPASGRDYNYYLEGTQIDSSNWGIWAAYIDGIYEGITPASDNWNWSMEYRDGDKVIGSETTGTQWSNNKIAGADAGYWADIHDSAAATGILVGETRGTFDPTASTLQAVSAGVWLETNKFLEMAAGATTTETANAALKALNIPAVQVGKTTLTQASGTVNNLSGVTMSDVTFFATSTGNAPRIWATNNVGGSYTGAGPTALGTATGAGVPLTNGSGLSATFTPQVWNTTDNKWLSTVNGNGTLSGGSYTGAVDFKGGAAGTINNNGTFGANPTVTGSIGTAAGVAK